MDQPDLTGVSWRKASRSGSSGSCVELGRVGDVIAVRDSKDPQGPALVFPRTAWSAFTDRVRSDAL
jgi:hypothetical protein